MKLFRGIIALTLIVAFSNVIIGKTLHEIIEHEHHEHTCDVKDKIHYHDFEYAHADFICDFNFSTSFVDSFLNDFDEIIRYQEEKLKIHFLWLAKDLCSNTISLRGPPAIS